MALDYAEYFPWRDNLNWFGVPWKPRGPIMKAIDKVYYWTARALLSDYLPCPLGNWRGLYGMRARFYFEFRDELESPDRRDGECLTYDDLNAAKAEGTDTDITMGR